MKKLFAFSGHHLCAVKLHHRRLNADVGSSSPHLTYQFPSVLSVYFGDFELVFPPVQKYRKGLKPTCLKQQLSATVASEAEGFSQRKSWFQNTSTQRGAVQEKQFVCYCYGTQLFLLSVTRKWEARSLPFSKFLFVLNDDPRIQTLIMSFLLSSPQGTGPQRHLRHDRRYQRSLHRPRKPEQAVSIPGSEAVQNSCVPVWVGCLPSAVFLPLEQVRNQQKI